MDDLKDAPYLPATATSENTTFDYALAIAKVGALAFPFLGAGVTFVDLVTAPARGKRMDEFCERLRTGLNDLSQTVQSLTPDTLAKSDPFISAFAQAAQAALKTHQDQKLDALRNAVLNVAIGKESDPDRQQYFLAFVDRFSEKHLEMLKFLHDPAGFHNARGQKPPRLNHVHSKLLINTLVAQAFPNDRGTAENAAGFQLVEGLLDDLINAHFVAFQRNQETWVVPAYAIPSGGGIIGKMTTHLGEAFLVFIAEPSR